MTLMIREILPDDALVADLAVEALGQVIPQAAVEAVLPLAAVAGERERKLPAAVTLLLTIAMNLYAQEALPAVFRRLVAGLRWLWPKRANVQVTKGAISQARYRLGARPLVALFRQVCCPLATPATPGAFLFGYRLMAIDGTMFDLADPAANEHVFGRRPASRGTSAWP